MTDKQKKAIKILNRLRNANGGLMVLKEEEYFTLLECVLDNKKHFNGLSEEQWEDYFKNRETPSSIDKIAVIPCSGSICTNPFHDCINCPRQFSGENCYTITTSKVEEQH